MAWPTTLTDNAAVLQYIWEQGITRMLEPSNDYSALHQGVAIEVRLWLENHGIDRAANIRNPTDFAPAAAHLFFAKLIRSRDPALAESYTGKFLALMRATRPDLGAQDDPGSSGTVAKTVVIKQGSRYYTGRRSGAKFRGHRY